MTQNDIQGNDSMVIGLTGGVGCGKSTVMEILQRVYGAKLLIADNMGHVVMEKGHPAYDAVREQFGDGILCEDGSIDRGALAQLVYADDRKLKLLNAIIHPFVVEEIREKLQEWKTEPLIVLETAILFETGCDALCDEIWGIHTNRETRIKRLMESRGYTREKAESIMKKQMDEEEYQKRCDRILPNDGDRVDLEQRLSEWMKERKKN